MQVYAEVYFAATKLGIGDYMNQYARLLVLFANCVFG